MGVGGAPGEGVYLKAGASVDEPVSAVGAGQHLELNIDKGHQSQGGSDAGVMGAIANGDPATRRTRATLGCGRPTSMSGR